MGLQPTAGSADLFEEEGEHPLFLERIFHLTCIWALLSPKAALEPWGGRRAEDPLCSALQFSYLKHGAGAAPAPPVGWGRAVGFVSAQGTRRDESILKPPDHAASLKMLLGEHF